MLMAVTGKPDQASLGIIMMIMAIFCLSSMDVIVKFLSGSYDIWLLVWTRYIGQMIMACIVMVPRMDQLGQSRNLPLQVLRAFLLFLGTFCFFFGISSIELASATALLQTNPLFIVVGAYLLLGESLDWKKLAGVICGLVGAMIIIRPGAGVFSAWSLFPIAAAMGFSGYAIVTRFLSRSESIWTSFFYTTLFGTVFATIMIMFNWSTPALQDLPLFAAAAICGSIGQFLIIRALFVTQASVLAPYGYTSLIFSAFYGALVFGEFPDTWAVAGAMIIVVSGLYVWKQQTAQK